MSKVNLISYTKTENNLNLLEQIAYVARVSNPTNQNNLKSSEKLVKYLIDHKHWSPLEMVDLTLEIETTRDIARQILRHRSFVFQEFSQRYAKADLGWEAKEARLQDLKNRQNSIETNNVDLKNVWYDKQLELVEHSKQIYEWAIDNGIAKEVARAVLPEGNTISRMYMKGSLRSWIHYISIRTSKETQKEHRDIAKLCSKEIEKVFPMIACFVFDDTKTLSYWWENFGKFLYSKKEFV